MNLHDVVDPVLRRFRDDQISEEQAQQEIQKGLEAAGMSEALYYIFVTLRVMADQKAEGIVPDNDLVM